MKIVCLRHVPFEGPGCIVGWARARGHAFAEARVWECGALPSPGDLDWLVILGGPMSVNDEARHAWLIEGKRLIGAAIEAGKTVLGICLGAQLIADVLGARVYPNKQKEIGWFPVWKTDGSSQWQVSSRLPESFMAFHWHGETFDVPAGAIHWLSSEGCVNQAFAYADRVVALQCHFEVTPESVRGLVDNCGNELGAGPLIQTPSEMIRDARFFETANMTMTTLLDALERMTVKTEERNA